ncbi:MAG TPA: sigma-54-dependent Fis family transcriptional regulator [Sulfurospirillum arcachonense]|nr:sigma-54-dependent Fis family transcriptional regulator [Sulfurospirillum arcachonense]HIP44117.1 sigma-54-dependent Fis family transcriptional regulator [Sulfurospirillum arcachonense]
MNIAIVEDDINMRKSLEFALAEYSEFSVQTYKSAIDALKKIDSSVDLIVTDINMPMMDGIEFIKELDGRYDIIVITGNATLNRAIESVRLGVKDFLTKPFEVDTLVDAIKRQVKISKKIKTTSKNQIKKADGDFIATSPALEKVLKLSKKAARTDASVLLMGESGVGKELFANFVHKNSPRLKGKFVAINMAAIPENLLESELFGYEKGAFTDATTSKKGHFEIAHGGTLFLDEIADMPINLQAKLLRVLQERVITRVGGTKEIEIDVRIVSATNANIHESIEKGEFREDLYYRLNTIPVHIPPLRERREEIEPIANHILKDVCKKYELDELEFSNEALNELNSYKWPGNIRELISVVERAAILSDNNVISLDDLFLDSRNTNKTKSIDSMEKELIKEVLQSVQSDKVEAAKILGMSKTVLNKKIEKYNIEVM